MISNKIISNVLCPWVFSSLYINPLVPKLFFLIFAHPVFKM
jgi:hypothetical protein